MPFQTGHIVGPALRGEGPQLAGEPRVEHVLLLMHVVTSALRAGIHILHQGVFPAALFAVEHRDTMTPPQLTRDAPVFEILHPGKVGLRPTRGVERNGAGGDGLGRRAFELVDRHEPLLGQPGLKRRVAAVAVHDGMVVVLHVIEQPVFLEPCHHGLTALVAAHAAESAVTFDHMGRFVEDVDLLKTVALAHGVVVGVVSWGDLHEARTETGIDVEIGEDGDIAIDDRKLHRGADELVLVVVLRTDRNTRVSEHGLGTRGGNDDVILTVDGFGERVAQMPQMPILFLVLGLIVGDGGGAVRAPIHDALTAIDKVVVVPIAEHLADRLRVVGVHGEMRIGEVDGAAHALDLLDDVSAVFMCPVPAGIDERIAADLAARDALGGELLVNLRLRGDAGMVGAQNPAGRNAAHAVHAHERVLNGVVHGVTHVQHTRDVRRRNGDRAVSHTRVATVIIAGKPLIEHTLLAGLWVVGFRHFLHATRSPPTLGLPARSQAWSVP